MFAKIGKIARFKTPLNLKNRVNIGLNEPKTYLIDIVFFQSIFYFRV